MQLTKGEIEQRTREFEDASRRDGLKITIQRLEIFKALASTQEHPDAQAVFSQVRLRLPTISPDTVYRTLAMLEERGLISRLDLAVGRTRFDANTDRHHHFICSSCGYVRDIYSAKLDELPPPPEIRAWGQVQSRQVHFRGLCAECWKRKRTKKRESRQSDHG